MDSALGVSTSVRMTVKQVADALNCSPDTIRRYANEFSLYLSSEASPERGATRVFDERDVSMLRLAREQMSSGKNFDQVRASLSMMDFSENDDDTPVDTITQPEVDPQPALNEVTTSMLTLVDAVAATQAQLAALPEINHRLGVITESLQAQTAMKQQMDTMTQDISDLTIKNVQLTEDIQKMRKQGVSYFVWFLVGSGVAVVTLVTILLLMNAGWLPR